MEIGRLQVKIVEVVWLSLSVCDCPTQARYLIIIFQGPDGIPDGNPETVIIGAPLDKTKNPQVAVGFALSDITGVVTYQWVFNV